MKKNVIAMLLAVVMASGSIGTVPVMAAETNGQESMAVEVATEKESEETGENIDVASEGESVDIFEEDSEQDSTESAEESENEITEESVTIPSGLRTIKNYAFSYSYSFNSITIPQSVNEINPYAF